MSSNYPGAFGSNDDEEQIFNIDTSGAASRYGRGSHMVDMVDTQSDPDGLRADAESLRGINDDAADLLEQAAGLYEGGAIISAFECAGCGLRHSHSQNKHVLTEGGHGGLKVRNEFADVMVYNRRCHCGVNELSMLLRFADAIEMQIFADIENDEIPRPELVNVAERLKSTNRRDILIDELGEDIVAEAVEYKGSPALQRVLSVRNAADSAPISAETRQDIEEIGDEIEAEMDADPLENAFEEHADYNKFAPMDERVEAVSRSMWKDLFKRGEDHRLTDVREFVRERFEK